MASSEQDKIDINEVNRLAKTLLDTPVRRSHTHRDTQEIENELQIGPVEGFFLWLSKTDLYVLNSCTYSARRTLQSLGFMVAFTSTLALFSAMYTIMTTVMTDQDFILRWPMGLALSAVYAFGIMTIDREIVASKGGWMQGAIRLVFAGLIATAVSYPVKLKFFEGAIRTEIQEMAEKRHADELKRLENPNVAERSTQRQLLEKEIASYAAAIAGEEKDERRQRENLGGCGPQCTKHKENRDALIAKSKAAFASLQSLDKPNISAEHQAETQRLRALIKTEAASSDLLTKWNAVDSIKRKPGNDYETISNFIFAFFMALELVPLILKYSLGKSEYNYYIMARDQINAQKMISIANLYIKAMQEDPRNALKVPDEITDLFHHVIEDEARPRMTGFYAQARAPVAGAVVSVVATTDSDRPGIPPSPAADPDATILELPN